MTAAGWFDDPDSAGIERYWDGSAWTEQRRPKSAPPVATPSSPTAAEGEFKDRAFTWMKAHKVLTAVAALFLVGSIGAAFGEEPPEGDSSDKPAQLADGKEKHGEDQAAQTDAVEDSKAAELAAEEERLAEEAEPSEPDPADTYGKQPGQEKQVIDLTKTAQDAGDTAEDLKLGAALSTRNQGICAALGSGHVDGWTGFVDTLDANGDGFAIVSVEIADNIFVTTWNNALSDSFDGTLIEPRGLYDKVTALEEGDVVRFSGEFMDDSDTCVNDSRMTLDGKVNDPEFIFRFKEITKVG